MNPYRLPLLIDSTITQATGEFRQRNASRVALVSMPWGPVTEPSLGVSILKSELAHAGVDSRVFHFELDCLRYLLFETYVKIAGLFAVNDFAFSGIFSKKVSDDQFSRVLQICLDATHDLDAALTLTEKILRFREQVVPRYLERCVSALMKYEPSLIGMTCCYDQTFASLALARAFRRQGGKAKIVLGGYAVSGETGAELLRVFPDIDAVANGDGEGQIVRLAAVCSANEGDLSLVPNLLYRDNNGVVKRSAVTTEPIAMDRSPVPDFSDFFGTLEQLKAEEGITVSPAFLPIEFSRGCWWGQKHHCVFCGIDDQTLRYRSRTPEMALQLLETLHLRYQYRSYRLADYILPHQFHESLIPLLISQGSPYKLACEVKANLSYSQIKNLASAGFYEIQPGIESLSTSILKLMKKGVTAPQNICLLLSAAECGLLVRYNILLGIPGERVEDYVGVSKIIPSLVHLEPPVSHSKTRFTRNAPMQAGTMRADLPAAMKAHSDYSVIFSNALAIEMDIDLDKYCYYYEPTYVPSEELIYWHNVIHVQCSQWTLLRRNDPRPYLYFQLEADGGILFLDGRDPLHERVIKLSIAHKEAYLKIYGIGQQRFSCRKAALRTEEESLLADLAQDRLIISVDDYWIALAIRRDATAVQLFESSQVDPGQNGNPNCTILPHSDR